MLDTTIHCAMSDGQRLAVFAHSTSCPHLVVSPTVIAGFSGWLVDPEHWNVAHVPTGRSLVVAASMDPSVLISLCDTIGPMADWASEEGILTRNQITNVKYAVNDHLVKHGLSEYFSGFEP